MGSEAYSVWVVAIGHQGKLAAVVMTLVVDVRIVRMTMRQRRVGVLMRMRFAPVPIVRVLVVLIVQHEKAAEALRLYHIGEGLLVIAGILTIWSGLYYLRAAWPMLRGDAPSKPTAGEQP